MAISGPVVVLGGHGWVPIIHFLMGIISYLTFLALESTQGPEGAPDGQDLAISGPNVVLGGQGLVLIIRFSLGINSYLTLLALKSIQGTEAVPLGQVLGHFRPP